VPRESGPSRTEVHGSVPFVEGSVSRWLVRQGQTQRHWASGKSRHDGHSALLMMVSGFFDLRYTRGPWEREAAWRPAAFPAAAIR